MGEQVDSQQPQNHMLGTPHAGQGLPYSDWKVLVIALGAVWHCISPSWQRWGPSLRLSASAPDVCHMAKGPHTAPSILL